jgi:lysophospholipase L1-like esterase
MGSKRRILALTVIIIGVFCILFFLIQRNRISPQDNEAGIVFVPVGDSFTIGLGVEEGERWPNMLVDRLRSEGIEISIADNPAVSGYTVRDAIVYELPSVEKFKPDIVTVFIGTNDSFVRRNPADFRQDLVELLDKLQRMMGSPKNTILITVPDYSVFPGVRNYPDEGLSDFIDSYNVIIREEADRRGLGFVDLTPVSRTMTDGADFVKDGLHPSAVGYTKWEKEIYPAVKKLLGK